MKDNLFPIDQIRHFAMQALSSTSGSHDWSHTIRVFNLSRHIGEIEGADINVVMAAAYLHDIGRPYQDESKGRICHAEKGAEIAAWLLDQMSISRELRENIIHSIRSHRFRNNIKPQTLEAKVLFDADKLDSIGAIGIARAFQFAGEVGASLHNPSRDLDMTEPYTENDTAYREFILKLSSIKDNLNTHEGIKIAKERHSFMEYFFKQFLHEYNYC